MEIWKEVDGYNGDYLVSTLGRVKSLKCNKEMIMKKTIDQKYEFVNMYNKGVPKMHRVHRLVAKAFLPNPNNYPIINHKDEVECNNHVDNLEWCTYAYNNAYGGRIERFVDTVSKPIYQFTLEGEFVREFKNTRDVKDNGYIRANVTACCKGRRKTHRGFVWKYKEECHRE